MAIVSTNVFTVGSSRAQRTFSFIEVLFAVMILGIGFIMIAAIFPVAIQQTTTAVEVTTSSRLAANATGAMKEYYNAGWPSTNTVAAGTTPAVANYSGEVWWLRDPRGPLAANVWYNIAGNLISTDNARYAYIPLYQRGLDATTPTPLPNPGSTMFIVSVVARNADAFQPMSDLLRWPTGYPDTGAGIAELATLEPRPVHITLVHRTDTADDTGGGIPPDLNGRDLITIRDIPSGTLAVPFAMDAAVEGAFVIISDRNSTGVTVSNGRIFRLGTLRQTLSSPTRTQWELPAGYEMTSAAEDASVTQNVIGLLIGRSLPNPRLAPTGPGGGNAYTGPSMAVDVKMVSLP